LLKDRFWFGRENMNRKGGVLEKLDVKQGKGESGRGI